MLLADGGAWQTLPGRDLPSHSPTSKQMERAEIPFNGLEKKVLPPQAGIYDWAVTVSLPPSILPSSPSSTLLTPNPVLEALSSSAVRVGGTEHLELLSGDLNRCQDWKGSQWVSSAAAQTLSSGICPALAQGYPGGLPFCWAPGRLLGDRILPVLRWSVVTVAPVVLLTALALWLPCMALQPTSCHGEVWGPPRALRGVLGAALLCPVLCFTRTPR